MAGVPHVGAKLTGASDSDDVQLPPPRLATILGSEEPLPSVAHALPTEL